MIPTRNAEPLLVFLAAAVLASAALASAALAACTRPPPDAASPGADGPSGEAAAPAKSGSRPIEPASRTGTPAARPASPGEPPLRAATPDRLIGNRPLARFLPADYSLGDLEDLSASGSPQSSAVDAARIFLDGLTEGRVEGAVPDARDVILFMVKDLLDDGSRVLRWRLGRGLPRPEGGWIFPVLLVGRKGRILGDAILADTPGTGWGLELVVLDRESEPWIPGGERGLFDPTIRTVKPTGR